MNKFEKKFSEKMSTELEEFSRNLQKNIIGCITKQLNGAVIDVVKTNHNATLQPDVFVQQSSSTRGFDTPQNGKRSKTLLKQFFIDYIRSCFGKMKYISIVQ